MNRPERHLLDLRSIATPIEDCVSLSVGQIQPEVVARLREGDFDQAPVLDTRGDPIGVLDTVVAEQVMKSGDQLAPSSSGIVRDRLPSVCSVNELLAYVARARGVLVEEDGRIGWLVTLSDLNRHRLRGVLYGTFAELEALLALLIDVGYDDPWEWLDRLHGDAQARLVGYWEVSKRRGVNIGPQAGSTITELLSIVAGSDRLRGFLGYPSRAAFHKETGALPEYRNRVMHPVRPLVTDQNDVEALHHSFERAEVLIDRARHALADRGFGSRVHWFLEEPQPRAR